MLATDGLVVGLLLPWSLQVLYLSPCSLLPFPLRPPLLFQRLQQPSPAISITGVMATRAMAVLPAKPKGGIIRWREQLRHKALRFNLICPLCRRGICAQLLSSVMMEKLGEG